MYQERFSIMFVVAGIGRQPAPHRSEVVKTPKKNTFYTYSPKMRPPSCAYIASKRGRLPAHKVSAWVRFTVQSSERRPPRSWAPARRWKESSRAGHWPSLSRTQQLTRPKEPYEAWHWPTSNPPKPKETSKSACDEQKVHQIRSRSCHRVNPAIAISGSRIQRLPQNAANWVQPATCVHRTPSKRQGLRAVARPGSESRTQRLLLPSASSKQCHMGLIMQVASTKTLTRVVAIQVTIREQTHQPPDQGSIYWEINSRATIPGHGCALSVSCSSDTTFKRESKFWSFSSTCTKKSFESWSVWCGWACNYDPCY